MLSTSGRSFSDAAVSLKTSKTDDNHAALWQELLRYWALYCLLDPSLCCTSVPSKTHNDASTAC